MKKNLSNLALLVSLLFPVGQALAASTTPIVDKGVVFDAASTRTPEQVRGYILHAAETFRAPTITAKIESDNPGALQLEFNKENNHYLSVLFTYDHAGFKASYVASKNLNYAEKNGVRVIHENSMIWMDEIIKTAKAAYAMQLNAKGEATNPHALAELGFRSTGATDKVSFQKSDHPDGCGDYDELGDVANQSESEIAAREQERREWLAKYKTLTAVERRFEPKLLPPRVLTLRTPASRPIVVSASSFVIAYEEVSTTAGGGNLFGAAARRERHSCGPLKIKFTPQGARKYSIEYAVSYSESRGGKCTQAVFDVTDPDKRIPVPPEVIAFCRK